ncbi:MAG: methyltransferase domain-containing protein [candidate division WOR-3 bacterium]
MSSYWRKRRVWDRFQEEQDPILGRIHQGQRAFVINAVAAFAQGRGALAAIDLGAGTGRIACDLLMMPQVRELLAVDINPRALRKVGAMAAKRGLQTKLRLRVGDFYRLDWRADEVFDVVLCIDVLHHLPDVALMLEIVCGRMTQDGIFVGNIRATEKTSLFFNRYGLLKRALVKLQPTVNRLVPQNSILRQALGDIGYLRLQTYSRPEVEGLLKRSGFQICVLNSSHYHTFVCRKAQYATPLVLSSGLCSS